MYRAREPTLAGDLTPERSTGAVAALPAGILFRRSDARPPPGRHQPNIPVLDGVKDGAFAERDGAIVVRSGEHFEPLNLPGSIAARVRGMLAVRDAVRLVFKTQLDDAPDERITEARRLLNELYDSFVRRYGALSSRENVRAFAGDPDHPLLLSLETYDPETKRAAKTAIFERRTLERYRPVEHVETAAEALAISLNETGEIDWPRMEQLTGRQCQDFAARTRQPGLPQPRGRDWETADRYLSGNVRAKLASRARRRRARSRPISRNIEALGSRAARRPAAGRHRGAPRLLVDSADRHPGFHRRTCSTSATRRSRIATPAPSPPGPSRLEARREIERQPTPRRTAPRAFPRVRPHRAGSQRPHADRL